MRYRSSLVVAVLLGILALGTIFPNIDDRKREMVIIDAVVHFIKMAHFQPKEIDDEFSKEAFSNYIKSLDPAKRFFTQKEVDQLKVYELQYDDQILQKKFDFFDQSVVLIDQSFKDAKLIYDELIAADYDFSQQEEVELDYDKKSFAKDQSELREYWRKALKYEVLTRYYDNLEDQKDSIENEAKESEESTVEGEDDKEEEAFVPLSDDELKAKAIKQTKEVFDDWFERMESLRRSDRFEAYINAITHVMDPHSDYFNPKEKQDFDINMGGKLEGIGARLVPDKGYTKVREVIPGGPAWASKQIEADDLIIKVTQKGEDAVDLVGMRLDDVVQLIRGKKGTEVLLTIKKPSGDIIEVPIIRDIVQIDETKAKSLLLDLEQVSSNIGYIKLPKFYSSFEQKNGNSCSVDVAEEIEKLKQDGAQGIILDLRSNGGGSLRDVVDMTGLFVEDGPIVQVKPRTRNPYVYDDQDKESRYDGPLVVLVNSFSASASEILAAALQDYNRAVIVGSNSTFGKGTVQRFFDLDEAVMGNDELKPLGQVKLTMQKFYRIDGGSTQLKGVIPDIILPDNYSKIETGEKDYDNAMEWSKINPVPYSQETYNISNKAEVVRASSERVKEDKDFQLVLENAERLKRNRDQSIYPLTIDGYSNYLDKRDEESEKFKDLWKDEIEGLSVRNLSADQERIDNDEVLADTNKDWIKRVKKDFYLKEALHIMRDLKSNNDIAKMKTINP